MPQNAATSKGGRTVANLIQTKSVDNPDQFIHHRRLEVEQWRNYWKKKQEQYFEETFDTNAPPVAEVNQIRRFLNQFLGPKLDEISKLDRAAKLEALRFIIPFNSDGGITDFMLHFFQVERVQGKLEYAKRDDFEKEVHILYDIYKIKKTIECIDVMRKTVDVPGKMFPSRYSEGEKVARLEELREVLKVLFKFSIKTSHQKEIYSKIDLDMISSEAILERREKGLFYCFPHVIAKYDYRNLFFLIYFRDGLTTKVGDGKKELRYDYLSFEVMKQEFLTHWLMSKLKDSPAKRKIYDATEVDGRTISSWIDEDPAKEIPLLQKLPANRFNALVEKVDQGAPPELKAGMPTLSESEGPMAQMKEGAKKAAKAAKAPLEKLRQFFSLGKKKPAPAEAGADGEAEDAAAPAAAAPQPEAAKPEPKLEIVVTAVVDPKRLGYYYLTQSASRYGAAMTNVKKKLGGEYPRLQKATTKILELYGAERVLRRRTPKHDWAVGYHIQYKKGDDCDDYLFIVGGEAKMKHKGMGYSSGDEYVFTAYCVLCAERDREDWGPPKEERPLGSKTFKEYDIGNEVARKKAIEFMEMVWKKEFPDKDLRV